ncbi:uncharacterized protein L203_102667 [Cryptococcus depauperatus CBS 7841]|uniref:Uncharacterized protein n=1 Tax=Cryptococcus depauperatus CBS 7841 TaxID=1295531 RepID=A0A1E3IDT3_9TREE|nr:hypothetical protein L203_04034 [Cryptococcus depauperatus CBS 7841]
MQWLASLFVGYIPCNTQSITPSVNQVREFCERFIDAALRVIPRFHHEQDAAAHSASLVLAKELTLRDMPPGISTNPQRFTAESSPQRPFPFHISPSHHQYPKKQPLHVPTPAPSSCTAGLANRPISTRKPNPPSASTSAEPNNLPHSPNISEPSHGSAPNIRSVAAADHGPAFQRLE